MLFFSTETLFAIISKGLRNAESGPGEQAMYKSKSCSSILIRCLPYVIIVRIKKIQLLLLVKVSALRRDWVLGERFFGGVYPVKM